MQWFLIFEINWYLLNDDNEKIIKFNNIADINIIDY